MGEFLQRTARLDEMLATLAGKLNSNESFNPDRGFQVDVVFVSMPGPGSGHRKQSNSGRLCLDRENKRKRCIVAIKNRDTLCCARAIVTMQAHCHKDQGVDGFRQWDNLKRGRPVQQRQAQELHREAGVAEGPCGLPELRQFQQALGPQYQLLVMTRMKPFFLIFKGPAAPLRFVYSSPMIILMAARPFLPLSTVLIIAWTVNGGSTPTIGPIIPVKGNVALRVADLTVFIMCVVPGPRIIAPCVTASFTVPIANAIML